MGLIFLPPVDPSAATFGSDSDNLSHRSRKGYVYTVGRNVHPWVATLSFLNRHNKSTTERAQIAAFIAEMRGEENRGLFGPPASAKRGAFPAVELLTNGLFDNGVTGWAAQFATLAVSDRVMRATSVAAGVAGSEPQFNQVVGVTPHVPYVGRGMFIQGRGPAFSGGVALNSTGTSQTNDYSVAGLRTIVHVPAAATLTVGIVSLAVNQIAGDFFSCSLATASRCLLVDAHPNAFQRSDELEHAYWVRTGLNTITANINTAADGTVTADRIIEDGLTSQHALTVQIARASVIEDWCASVEVARSVGTRNARLVVGSDGTNFVEATFDLGNGTISVAASASGTVTNPRAYITSLGNGIYRLFVLGRLPATTTVFLGLYLVSGTANSYAGDNASALSARRLGAARSSVPLLIGQTTTAAASGTSPTGGVINVKGGRAPGEGALTGALLKDDFVEVLHASGSSLDKCVAPLDLDAAGIGYLQFTPPLIESIADNAAIIVANPLAKWRFVNQRQMWSNKPGFFSDFELEFEQDLTP